MDLPKVIHYAVLPGWDKDYLHLALTQELHAAHVDRCRAMGYRVKTGTAAGWWVEVLLRAHRLGMTRQRFRLPCGAQVGTEDFVWALLEAAKEQERATVPEQEAAVG